MKVLSIETATSVCGAAVIEDKKVLRDEFIEQPHMHSESIIGLIERVLRSATLTINQIDGIAVSIGPGSFTGLRIGLSVAKGLAYAANKPLTAVSTLEALARNTAAHIDIHEPHFILPTIDARRDELYAAGYRWDGGAMKGIISPRAISVSALFDLLHGEQKIILVGNGMDKFREYFSNMDESDRFIIPLREFRICSATAVGFIGIAQFERGEQADMASLEPFYIKEFYTTLTPQQPVKH